MNVGRSGPHGAVFLSYASQDAEAVQRIADALKRTGVEVWFDKNELRGGDAWDQKIRRQIKECALFVPVISANTQARPEGYFRLEWKLAVDRSHLMAEDQPFLVPVVIDDTPEPAARVPEKFRDVQWTRLRLDETPAEFGERVRTLLSGAAAAPMRAETARESHRAGRGPAFWWGTIIPLAGVLVGLVYALRPIFQSRPPPRRQPAGQVAPAAAPLSEARKLAAQARTLIEPWDGATREDFALAGQLLKKATDMDPADGEVWATYGLMLCGELVFGHDRSNARWELARTVTERAVKLAPDSNNARFAQAFYFRFNAATSDEAERMLRELVEKMPQDKLVIRTLAAKLRNDGKFDEALTLLDRAIALPGGDPVAHHNKYLSLWRAGRHAEAEAALDAALALKPTPYLHRDKVQTMLQLRGEVDEAAKLLAKINPAFLLEDSGVHLAAEVWLWKRDPDKCLAAIRPVARDIIEGEFGGPKAYLSGMAYHLAGRSEAAKTEWGAALNVAEKQLAAEPNNRRWLFWKAYLLASLGRAAEAEAALKTYEQLNGLTEIGQVTAQVHLLLGRKEEVVAVLEKYHGWIAARGNPGNLAIYENMLRYDPTWDALRDDPRFQKLIAKR